MEYNKTRSPLTMREYGRNIQKMGKHVLSIDDKDKRTLAAKTIVQIMSQMNPQIKEGLDYNHKLWDHLHVITQYQLDVDSPYEKPIPMEEIKAERLRYSDKKTILYRHYGKTIQSIIDKATAMTEGEEKDALVRLIANHMKKSFLLWNKNSVTDEIIATHLSELSNGKLKLPETFIMTNTSDILKNQKKPRYKQQKQNNKFSSNNNRQKRKRTN